MTIAPWHFQKFTRMPLHTSKDTNPLHSQGKDNDEWVWMIITHIPSIHNENHQQFHEQTKRQKCFYTNEEMTQKPYTLLTSKEKQMERCEGKVSQVD